MSGENEAGASTFPREARLRTPKQFQATFSQGRRLNAALFRLHLRLTDAALGAGGKPPDVPLPTQDASPTCVARLGISVSKRVAANAVERNRIRRVARESFRSLRVQLPPGDYVLLAQREAAGAPSAALRESLLSLWGRVCALKPTGSAPTMPIPASKSAKSEQSISRSTPDDSLPAPRRASTPDPSGAQKKTNQ